MKLAAIKGQASWPLKSDRVKLWITQKGGHVGPVTFSLGGRAIQPYSVAPWADERLPADAPEVLRILRGDFFCMPFGDSGQPWKGEKHPPHGEVACGKWTLARTENTGEYSEAELTLRTKIRRGRVRKIIRLRAGETVVYSRHVLEGTSGPMCFGHHPMLLFPKTSGILSTSPFQFGQVLPCPLENPAQGGYSSLKQGAIFHSLQKVKLADGGYTDLSRYPAREGFEDLALLATSQKNSFAWTAVTFPGERFVWFALKDPKVLTATLLWMSNGGRHYPPWNGRHRNVMGIEDITGYFNQGLAASVRPNPLNRRGVKTTLMLNSAKPLFINHITGIAAIPSGFEQVQKVEKTSNGIILHAKSGRKTHARVEMSFLDQRKL